MLLVYPLLIRMSTNLQGSSFLWIWYLFIQVHLDGPILSGSTFRVITINCGIQVPLFNQPVDYGPGFRFGHPGSELLANGIDIKPFICNTPIEHIEHQLLLRIHLRPERTRGRHRILRPIRLISCIAFYNASRRCFF